MKDESKTEVYGCLILLLITPISTVVRGAVLTQLWGWFILPVFNSAPALTLVQAIGVSLVVSYFTMSSTTTKEEKKRTIEERVGFALAWAVFAPLLTLLIGYIIYLFT